jgi:molybdopterin/thiamine biosynthesis adenylyltransferase
MDDKQLLRYSRHILLDQIDVDGQEKLLSAHVLIIGAGGLGSPAATYLAGAGIGHLTICDDDVVDMTNLQRQILHRESRIGVKKVASARIALEEINPDCKVTEVPERVGPEQLAELVAKADVVVEASDNFATRHAVNKACVAAKKPLVSGAAIRFAGQLSVFDTREENAPCYACLFPESSSINEERCATMGVLAPLTGTIGSMQATEAIQLILNGHSNLTGRLMLYDAIQCEWQDMRIPRNKDCDVCGGPAAVS